MSRPYSGRSLPSVHRGGHDRCTLGEYAPGWRPIVRARSAAGRREWQPPGSPRCSGWLRWQQFGRGRQAGVVAGKRRAFGSAGGHIERARKLAATVSTRAAGR